MAVAPRLSKSLALPASHAFGSLSGVALLCNSRKRRTIADMNSPSQAMMRLKPDSGGKVSQRGSAAPNMIRRWSCDTLRVRCPQVREIPANTFAFVECVQRALLRSAVRVTEFKSLVREIADGLHAPPAG